MPNWEPNWEDVRWDHVAAADAAAALERAALTLEHEAGQQRAAAARDAAEWRGEHRRTFDERLQRLLSAAAELAERCRGLSGRVRGLDAQARAEQARREREREDWEREREEERERERREGQCGQP